MGKNKALWALILLVLGSLGLYAQVPDAQLVFAYTGVSTADRLSLSATETELLDTRYRSYLLEIARQERYTLTTVRDGNVLSRILALNPETYLNYLGVNRSINAQGMIAVFLEPAPSGLFLSAGIYDPGTGELLHSNRGVYNDFQTLVEDSRRQFYDLFGLPAPVENRILGSTAYQGPVGSLVNISVRDLAGLWKGDFDLGEVRIQADGSALARLEGGETLKLSVTVSNNIVTIRQNEPNAAKIYMPSFPLSVAGQIARVARPMYWEFELSPDKTQLVGTKHSSKIYLERGQITQVDNSYFRDAVWIRIP